MKNHIIWMIIGCGLPLLLIFFAPALGLGFSTTLLIFFMAMFACHLLMPMLQHEGHNHEERQQNIETIKIENYAHYH
jgi:hypothetical protein